MVGFMALSVTFIGLYTPWKWSELTKVCLRWTSASERGCPGWSNNSGPRARGHWCTSASTWCDDFETIFWSGKWKLCWSNVIQEEKSHGLPESRWVWAVLIVASSWRRINICFSQTLTRGPWSGRRWRLSWAASSCRPRSRHPLQWYNENIVQGKYEHV